MTVYDIFFYFYRCVNCMSNAQQPQPQPQPLQQARVYRTKQVHVRIQGIPTQYDIMNVTTSINIIFSKLSPGYTDAIARRQLNHSTSPIVYFYKIVYIELALNDIYENDMYSRIFMDVMTCIIECIKEPFEKWGEIAVFYNIHHILRNDMELLWEILSSALATILIEPRDGEIIGSWETIFWKIYEKVEGMAKEAFFINI